MIENITYDTSIKREYISDEERFRAELLTRKAVKLIFPYIVLRALKKIRQEGEELTLGGIN